MALRWQLRKKGVWGGCLQSHRTGPLNWAGFFQLCMSEMIAELLLPSFGTRFYLRSFHKMVLSLSLPSDLFMSKLDASREDVLRSARMESGGLVWATLFSLFPRGWHRWHSWDGRTSQVYPLKLMFVLTILLLTLVGGKGMSAPLISACPGKRRRLWLGAVGKGVVSCTLGSQNSCAWKGPLGITWSNAPTQSMVT